MQNISTANQQPILSDRQQEILRYIHEYRNAHGFAPSMREIGDAVRIASTSVINYNLNRLVEHGYLDRKHEVPRSYVVREAGYHVLKETAPESDEVRQLRLKLTLLEAENTKLRQQNKTLMEKVFQLRQNVIDQFDMLLG